MNNPISKALYFFKAVREKRKRETDIKCQHWRRQSVRILNMCWN